MKLPEIKVAHYKNFGGNSGSIAGNGRSGLHSREMSMNGTEEKRERLRQKLEQLYQVKMPKQKSLKLSSNHNIRGLDDNLSEGHQLQGHHNYGGGHHGQKPPLMIKKNYNGAASMPSGNAL